MLEQEVASIAKLILDVLGKPTSYFHEVPEKFVVPSVYFPSPEIESDGDTSTTYRLDYSWYVMLFSNTSENAYSMGSKILNSIRAYRNAVSVINEDGTDSGDVFRIKDPSINMADNGACRLYIRWTSRRPYYAPDVQLAQYFHINGWERPDVYTDVSASEAIEIAASTYLQDYPRPQYAGTYPET